MSKPIRHIVGLSGGKDSALHSQYIFAIGFLRSITFSATQIKSCQKLMIILQRSKPFSVRKSLDFRMNADLITG